MGVGLKASQIRMSLEEKVEYSRQGYLLTERIGLEPAPQNHSFILMRLNNSLTGILWYWSTIGMSFELRYHLIICK